MYDEWVVGGGKRALDTFCGYRQYHAGPEFAPSIMRAPAAVTFRLQEIYEQLHAPPRLSAATALLPSAPAPTPSSFETVLAYNNDDKWQLRPGGWGSTSPAIRPPRWFSVVAVTSSATVFTPRHRFFFLPLLTPEPDEIRLSSSWLTRLFLNLARPFSRVAGIIAATTRTCVY